MRKSTNAYLPIITATDWSSALNDADEDQAGGGDWWTVMIPATTRGAGVTVPQDASEDTLIALFAGHGVDVRLIVYDPSHGNRHLTCRPDPKGGGLR